MTKKVMRFKKIFLASYVVFHRVIHLLFFSEVSEEKHESIICLLDLSIKLKQLES